MVHDMTSIEIFKANLKRLEELAILSVNKDSEINDVMFSVTDDVMYTMQKDYITISHKAEKLMIAFQDDFVGGLDALRVKFDEYKSRQIKRIEKQKSLEKAGFKGAMYRVCGKCKGTGMTGFTHVKGGICFGCEGTGKAFTTAYKKFIGMDDLPF